ncbi:MAG: DUF971 domain-containing protein [Pseudomonadota bacterium]|nr:DUF971 domain-containing protein [Pseudomonadota bacterium]
MTSALQPWPTELTLDQPARQMQIAFDDGRHYDLGFEFLRVHSPSAEVRGHGPGQEVLQLDKQDVGVLELRPVGNYGVQIVFSDGHDTGIYSWSWLRELGENRDFLWGRYLEQVAALRAASPK